MPLVCVLCLVVEFALSPRGLAESLSVAYSSPAKDWQRSLVTGNGTIGAMVRGNVADETISLSHCKLFLPEPGDTPRFTPAPLKNGTKRELSGTGDTTIKEPAQ